MDGELEIASTIPAVGQVVRVRARTYLVEAVDQLEAGGTLVRLACLDDDAQGQQLEVIWEIELDAHALDGDGWQSIGKSGFDPPRYFSAYIHTLRWNCVTATDPGLFQSPFRAGIQIDANSGDRRRNNNEQCGPIGWWPPGAPRGTSRDL